jgi:transcriptional regulator with XRE-family HTH domain
MPVRRDSGRTKAETRLAEWRLRRGLTQRQMSELTGLSPASYWRLERGQVTNPPIRYLVNCAIVLRCDWTDLLEEQYVQWLPLGTGGRTPPQQPSRRPQNRTSE